MREYITIAGVEILKSHALEKARKIKNNGTHGSELNNDELSFMVPYLAYWREDYLKNRLIAKIERVPEIKYGKGTTLKVYFSNGTTEYPSIRAGYSLSAQANAAMRAEVEQQIWRWKERYHLKDAKCAIHGGIADPVHIDHYPLKFRDIRDRFLIENNITLETLKTKEGFEGVGRLIADEALAEKWRTFHWNLAQYRILCASCNMKLQ